MSELLDYARENFAVEKPLLTTHRLQAFSPAYFTSGNVLFSYSQENCAASAAASAERLPPSPFISKPLGEPEAEWRRLDAAQLIRFFGNPAKFLVEQRLGLRLPRMHGLLEEDEPLEIDSLAKYKLQQDLLARALHGQSLAPLLPVLRASGELPPGHAGEARLRAMLASAEEFSEIVRHELGAAAGSAA